MESNLKTKSLFILKREVECSASSSFGSYPGYFGTGKSPEITISGQETSFLDELNTGQLKPQSSSHQQFTNNNITAYNPNLQHDLNHHQTLPPPPPQVYIPMDQREYHMNGFFEAPPPRSSAYNNNTNQTRFGSSSSSLPCSISMFDEYLFSQVNKQNFFCSSSKSILSQWLKIKKFLVIWHYRCIKIKIFSVIQDSYFVILSDITICSSFLHRCSNQTERDLMNDDKTSHWRNSPIFLFQKQQENKNFADFWIGSKKKKKPVVTLVVDCNQPHTILVHLFKHLQ